MRRCSWVGVCLAVVEEERAGGQCPGLMTAMVAWVDEMARSGLPRTLPNADLATRTHTTPITISTPATMRKAAHGARPAATRPNAAAISSMIRAREAKTAAMAN